MQTRVLFTIRAQSTGRASLQIMARTLREAAFAFGETVGLGVYEYEEDVAHTFEPPAPFAHFELGTGLWFSIWEAKYD